MNRDVVIFLKEECFVAEPLASIVSLNGIPAGFSAHSSLDRVTLSGPCSFPTKALERELRDFVTSYCFVCLFKTPLSLHFDFVCTRLESAP